MTRKRLSLIGSITKGSLTGKEFIELLIISLIAPLVVLFLGSLFKVDYSFNNAMTYAVLIPTFLIMLSLFTLVKNKKRKLITLQEFAGSIFRGLFLVAILYSFTAFGAVISYFWIFIASLLVGVLSEFTADVWFELG